ncbi:MAG: dTDP-4-dehydrorhamnose reductase [bacterium]
MGNLELLKDNKVLVAGSNGLLGQKLVKTFIEDYEVLGIDQKEKSAATLTDFQYLPCDITKRSEVQELMRTFKPNFIINAAAYTDVDGCEEDKENCWKVNVTGAENLAHSGRRIGALLVHISTDYVFDGVEGDYTEESKPNPLGYYGRSKLAGENAIIASGVDHAIVRTMILYGTAINIRLNFATWLIEKLSKREPVNIVDDQIGQPTLADDLAQAIRKIVELRKTGLYHIVGSESVDRYHFALKLAEVFDLDPNLIHAIKTDDLKQKAPRPLNSTFNIEKAKREFRIEMKGVEEGLRTLRRQLESSSK